MPFCEVAKHQTILDDAVHGVSSSSSNNDIKIFYKTYGHGPTKVLLIIGLAGTHDSWGPQIKGLTGTERSNDDDEMRAVDQNSIDNGDGGCAGNGVQVCAFDNRGMGRSSVPTKKSHYTTKIMAKDAIALMDHLGWRKAHVFGHSMGAMIACKLAAMVPDRVLSLALLNVTGGGFECLPKLDCRTLSVAIRFLKAKTPEQRAAVDLDTHATLENGRNLPHQIRSVFKKIKWNVERHTCHVYSLIVSRVSSVTVGTHMMFISDLQEYLDEHAGSVKNLKAETYCWILK